MIEATVKCLTCPNEYITNRHECNSGCRLEDSKAIHEGFCARCQRRMLKSMCFQIDRLPRLRNLEGETHGED
jgi:hypothetical protein